MRESKTVSPVFVGIIALVIVCMIGLGLYMIYGKGEPKKPIETKLQIKHQ